MSVGTSSDLQTQPPCSQASPPLPPPLARAARKSCRRYISVTSHRNRFKSPGVSSIPRRRTCRTIESYSTEDREDLSGLDDIALLHVDFGDGPLIRGHDFHFHLHRLHDEQRVPRLHAVTRH